MIGLVRRFRFRRWSDSIVVFLGFGFWCGVCSDLSRGDGADSSPLYEREEREGRRERERARESNRLEVCSRLWLFRGGCRS